MSFGKRLREIRMERRLTQMQVADSIHVALRTYQCSEQGKREPSFATLIALADVLEVSTDDLLGRSGCSDEKM